MSHHASVTRNVNCAANINNALEFPVLPVSGTARVAKLDTAVLNAFALKTATELLMRVPHQTTFFFFTSKFLCFVPISSQVFSANKSDTSNKLGNALYRIKLLLNLLKPTGYVMYQKVKHSTTVRSAHTVFMFCIYLRTNSDLCRLQHKLIGFYNRDEKCLLRGTNWVFK